VLPRESCTLVILPAAAFQLTGTIIALPAVTFELNAAFGVCVGSRRAIFILYKIRTNLMCSPLQSRCSKHHTTGGGTTRTLSWRVPLIISAILLGVAHTAQRLRGEGFQFLFVAQSADLSPFMMYGPLALLVFCAVVIAIDLATLVYNTRTRRARQQRGVHE
jgi:hypothetical protein